MRSGASFHERREERTLHTLSLADCGAWTDVLAGCVALHTLDLCGCCTGVTDWSMLDHVAIRRLSRLRL